MSSNSDLNNAVTKINSSKGLIDGALKIDGKENTYYYDEVNIDNYDNILSSTYDNITKRAIDVQTNYSKYMALPSTVPDNNSLSPDFNQSMSSIISKKNSYLNSANEARNKADGINHKCDIDGDNGRVSELRRYEDSINNTSKLSITLVDGIPKSGEWTGLIKNIEGLTTTINTNITSINNQKKDYDTKYDNIIEEKNRINQLTADINTLESTEKTYITQIDAAMKQDKTVYEARIADYINKVNLIKADNTKLVQKVEPRLKSTLDDTTKNKDVINKYNSFTQDHINLNQQQVNYLNKKKVINKNISLQNYEELYKAVILQNDILKNTLTETNNRLNFADREAELYDKKNIFTRYIYKYLFIVYFLFVLLLIIFFIFFEKELSYKMIILILILFISYPFRILQLELLIYNFWKYILSVSTGSVFTYTTAY